MALEFVVESFHLFIECFYFVTKASVLVLQLAALASEYICLLFSRSFVRLQTM